MLHSNLLPSRFHKTLQWQILIVFIILCAAYGCAAAAHSLAGDSLIAGNAALALLVWAIGIVLAIVASMLFPKSRLSNCFPKLNIPRWEWLALGFLFLFALLVRITSLKNIPPVFSGDEAGTGLFAVDLATGRADNPFTTGWYHFPSLFFYLPAASIALIGRTIEAVRIPAAIAGALTVVGVYGLGRILFGRTTGWISALLLAGLSFHIHFSRIGLNNIWDGFFIVFFLFFFWRGVFSKSLFSYLAAGLMLGFSQYFYASGRLLPWLLVLGLLWMRGLHRNERPRIPDLFRMALVAGVVILPLVLHYIGNPSEFWEPMSRASILPELETELQYNALTWFFPLLVNAYKSVMAFIAEPLTSYYTLHQPLLPPVLAVFFIVGVIVVFRRIRLMACRWLLIWAILLIGMNTLSEYPPAAHRYVLGAPLAVLIAATGLVALAQWAIGWRPQFKRIWIGAAIAVAVLASGVDASVYLTATGPSNRLYQEEEDLLDPNSEVAMDLANRLTLVLPETQVVFFGAPLMWYQGFPQLEYLAPQVLPQDVEFDAAVPALRLASGQHAIFIFLFHRVDEREAVKKLYPGGTSQSVFAEQNGAFLYVEYVYIQP